jgi:DNA-binding beta-propeller fold protein YncE
VWVASDDFVFIADYGNNRVQVLTPQLDFHAFVGVGQLTRPSGVCANDAVVVVSEPSEHRISVFSRGDGAVLRRFGSEGHVSIFGSAREDGVLEWPCGLCFTSDDRHIAVADTFSNCVSVFSLDGKFVRLVGAGKLNCPEGVACSASDELVVAEYDNGRVVVFSASGELLKTMGRGDFRGVAVHGGTVFAQDGTSGKCILFK